MATRLNLPHPVGAGAPDISPVFNAAWDFTDFASRARIGPRRYNTGRVNYVGPHENIATANQDVLAVQYVSDPLQAQTISGTIKGIVPCRESNLGANAQAQMLVRVCSSDGGTFRGTLLAFDTGGPSNELTTSAAPYPNVMFPRGHVSTTMTSVDALEGDRLVIEIGVRAANTQSTDFTFNFAFGDDVDLADCAEDEAGTTGAPWLELSGDLAWAANYTVSSTTISPADGALLAQIVAARAAGHDVLYLEAGTYSWSPGVGDATGTKMLRVRPVSGVAREDVIVNSGGLRPGPTNVRYLSLEDVTLDKGVSITDSYRFQLVGCRCLNVQLEKNNIKTTIQNCDIGGEPTALIRGYTFLVSADTSDDIGLQDTWVLGCNLHDNIDQDACEIRLFDNFVLENNILRDVYRDTFADQTVTVTGTGTFRLIYRGQTTTALAHNASSATVEAALQALSTIGSGGADCTGSLSSGMNCQLYTSIEVATATNTFPSEAMTRDATGITGTVTISTTGPHTDGFRTFLGGNGLTFRNNRIADGLNGQGFFFGGGAVIGLVLVENNEFGVCPGTFREFAIGSNTDRFYMINNTFADGGTFSNNSVHKLIVAYNNCARTGVIGFDREVGTTIKWAYRDYNIFGAAPTGITPLGANELTTGVTLTDYANDDYRLTSASDGQDYGIESAYDRAAPITDKAGLTRTFPCNVGAHEETT